jgi:hypothetical protein
MLRNGQKVCVRDHTSGVASMEMEDEPDQYLLRFLQAGTA